MSLIFIKIKKIRMNKIILTIISLLTIQIGYSQIESDYFSNIVPEATGVSSFSIYGNTPIDYYSGTPNISIPLFALKSHQLELPVTLQYNAKGFSESSWVGYKWELSAGGYIARDLRGLPDEMIGDGYLSTAQSTDNYQAAGFNTNSWVNLHERREKDTQPDEFVLSIAGRSIKFVFDKNGKAHTIPHQKVEIDYSKIGSKISRFVVTTEDGTIYTFGQEPNAIEETKIVTNTKTYHYELAEEFKYYDQRPTNWSRFESDLAINKVPIFGKRKGAILDETKPEKTIDWFNSKWHLIKIENIYNDFINFNYQSTGEIIDHKTSTTDVSQVLGYSKTKALVFELPHIATNVAGGDYSHSNKNGNFNSSTLILPNQQVHYVLGIGGDINTIPNWERLFSGSLDAPGQFESHGFWVENLGVRGVAKFGFTEPGSLPLIQDNIIQTNNSLYSMPLVPNISSSYPSKLGFNLREVAPNGGGKIESEIDIYTRKKRLYTVISKSGGSIGFDRSSENTVTGVNEKLASCTLKNNLAQLVRKFNLSYDAVNSTVLSLSQVSQEGITGVNMSPYEFTYENETDRKLIKTKYPTGGYTEYLYDGHLLKELKDYSDLDILSSHKILEYDSVHSFGTGRKTTYQNIRIEGTDEFMKYKIVSSEPQDHLTYTKGLHRGYGTVTEKNISVIDGSENGYTKYTYTTPNTSAIDGRDFDCNYVATPIKSNIPDLDKTGVVLPKVYDVFPFPQSRSKDYMTGLLVRKEVYTQGGKIVSKDEYNYLLNPYGYVPTKVYGFVGGKFNYSTSTTNHWWYGREVDPQIKYRSAILEYHTDWVVMDQSTTTVYDQEDVSKNIATTTEYIYDLNNLNMIESRRALGGDRYLTSVNKYVTDNDYDNNNDCQIELNLCMSDCSNSAYEDPEFDESECYGQCFIDYETCRAPYLGSSTYETVESIQILRSQNAINSIVEQTTLLEEVSNESTLSSQLIKYGINGANNDIVLPASIWNLEHSGSYVSSSVDNNGEFVSDSDYVLTSSFNEYDNHGNLKSATTSDGTSTEYTWGYNNTLVTEVRVNPGTNEQLSSFEHKPLVGVSKIIDTNGRETNYEYDDFNRLKSIKDHEGNIVERYRYHYKNQNIGTNTSLSYTGLNKTGTNLDFIIENFSAQYGNSEFIWDFGDGSVIENNIASTTHTYATSGTYLASVTIVNPENEPIHLKKTITIYATLATANVTYSGSIASGYNFQALLSAPLNGAICNNGADLSYSWSYKIEGSNVWANFGSNNPSVQLTKICETQIKCEIKDFCNNDININDVIINQGVSCSGLGDGNPH